MPFESRFDEPGTLTEPGPVGRPVRLVLGLTYYTLVHPGLSFVLSAVPATLLEQS